MKNREETMKTIVYPKSPKDIPLWRRRQITQDILWFTRYSPAERPGYVDREWAEIQEFIKDYSLLSIQPENRTRDEQKIEYLLKAKKLRKQ